MEIVNLHDETNGVSRQTYRDIVDIGTILSSAVDRLRRQAQVVKYRKERNLSAKQLEARTLELKKAKEWKNTVKVEANKKDALLHRAMEAEKGIDSLTEAIKLSENELVKALKREEKLQQRVNDQVLGSLHSRCCRLRWHLHRRSLHLRRLHGRHRFRNWYSAGHHHHLPILRDGVQGGSCVATAHSQRTSKSSTSSTQSNIMLEHRSPIC